jgi:very-short-patch-repair endonuclease
MIFSPVISEGISESTARWVETPHNQINVSVTRGREALFVVGDFDACRRRDGILGDLIRFVEDVQTLRDTSPYELELFSRLVTEGLDPTVHSHIGDIEVDFVLRNRSKGVKLAVEVDGKQHEEQKHQDQSRDAFLQSRGYRVVRIPTRSIEETPAQAIHKVKEALELS